MGTYSFTFYITTEPSYLGNAKYIKKIFGTSKLRIRQAIT